MPAEKSLHTVGKALKGVKKPKKADDSHRPLSLDIIFLVSAVNLKIAQFRLNKDAAATEAEIQQYCKDKGLGGYKVPHRVDFFEKLPRHIDGKIIKRELEKKYWEGVKTRG
ncbi:MAG: hypothetical protein KGY61_07060 [Desulfobacterales bacterium]|nr:hypothetical protein [Desulfobacterales bacterium]